MKMVKSLKVLDELPKPQGARGAEWDNFAWAATLYPGKAIAAAENVPESRIRSLRQYNRPPFVMPDGRIKVHMRNSYVAANGVRYGDVYFTWVPKEQP